jgi:hypothetical protein
MEDVSAITDDPDAERDTALESRDTTQDWLFKVQTFQQMVYAPPAILLHGHLSTGSIPFFNLFVFVLGAITHGSGVIAAKVVKPTLTLEEEYDADKSSDHRRFHFDRAICRGYMANAVKSISDQEPGFLQSRQLPAEQRRQYHLFHLRIPAAARTCLVLAHLQFGQHWSDVDLVSKV